MTLTGREVASPRTRHAVARFALGLGLSAFAALAVLGQVPPVFHAQTQVVVLHATVRNARGELVTDLDRGAFTVYENNKPQTITSFRRDDVPVSLGIVIDTSRSIRDNRPRVEAAALAFARASNPEDEVFVLNFSDRPHFDAPFTSDLKILETAIAGHDSIGSTALLDAVAAAEDYIEKSASRERKALFVVTDGNDNASLTPIDLVKKQAERSGITVYAFGMLSAGSPSKASDGRHALEQLTEPTGGLAYFPPTIEQIDTRALDIARQIRRQYTLAYIPADQALDGSYRKVRVVAKGSERLSVRTRAGYRAVPNSGVGPGGS